MYEVHYDNTARKQIAALPRDVSADVTDTVDRLSDWPFHGCDVKPLKGNYRHKWRLRIGDYRAIFTVDDARRKITVSRAFHRGKGY